MPIFTSPYKVSSEKVGIFNQLYSKYLLHTRKRKYIMVELGSKYSILIKEDKIFSSYDRIFSYTKTVKKTSNLTTIFLNLTPYMTVIAELNKYNKLYLTFKETSEGRGVLISKWFKANEFKKELFKTVMDILIDTREFREFESITIEDKLWYTSRCNKYKFYEVYNSDELLYDCLVYYNKYQRYKYKKLEYINANWN